MRIQKLLTKYSILLLVYIALVRFAQPYGLKLYYSIYSNPDMMAETVNTIQSIFTAVTFLINLIFVVFILVDSKQKKGIDWLIVVITFFSAETGIAFFLIWQIYKELDKNTRHNNKYSAFGG